MIKRCQQCQKALYAKTSEGITIRGENHVEMFIEGIKKITCECGWETYVEEK